MGCTPKQLPSTPPVRADAEYRVAVIAGNGGRIVTSIYALDVQPDGPGVWRVATSWSEGSWDEGGSALSYDSRLPKATDPWPVTLQHALSSVPARVALDARGRPSHLLDLDAWEAAASSAMRAAGLPAESAASAQALLDPEGVVADLQRNFPGLPSTLATWIRPERIAGVEARREETCVHTSQGKQQTWSCEGTVVGPAEGNTRLVDTTSTTLLVADRGGLLSLDSTYEGTMILLSPNGAGVIDRPIGGRRRVERHDPRARPVP